ncbi:MAG: tetratricopeptide repeat protein, partial [Verrucomicrobia bacterium]|nr:tetratricopeptide repeat protein [Verrucomicrobiota bacterium]
SDPRAHLIAAEGLLTAAVHADPTFAAAYAQLSLVHTRMYNWGNDRTDRRLELGLDAAQSALRLNPDLPEAELALGNYYYRGSRDYATASTHFQRALALTPNSPEALEGLAQIERRRGAFAAAADHYAAALALDPLNANLAYNTADTFLRLRRYTESSALLEQALARLPGQASLVKLRGDLHVAWTGDLGPMREDLAHREPDKATTADANLFDRIEYLILAHRLDDALAALRRSQFNRLDGQSICLVRDGFEALLLQLAGQHAEARAAALRALPLLERDLTLTPNDPRLVFHAGQMEAIIGSIPIGERRIARLFTPRDLAAVDAFDRGIYLRSLAILQANVGADDRARATLRTLLAEPNQTSIAYLARHPALARFAKYFP